MATAPLTEKIPYMEIPVINISFVLLAVSAYYFVLIVRAFAELENFKIKHNNNAYLRKESDRLLEKLKNDPPNNNGDSTSELIFVYHHKISELA